jgi:hypothetical protein
MSHPDLPTCIYALFFIQRLHRYHTTSLVVRAGRRSVVRKHHSAHVRRVVIDGALLQADEDDNERWVSTLEYDSAPENLAPRCSPEKTTRQTRWMRRMVQGTHGTLLSSRQSVLFDETPCVAYILSAEKNDIPRDNSKRVQTQ